MLVADWDQGSIKRFQSTGTTYTYKSAFASGFARLEGVAIGPDGFLYAIDWHLNIVKKLNAQTGTAIGVYLEGGNMLRPNSLAFWKQPLKVEGNNVPFCGDMIAAFFDGPNCSGIPQHRIGVVEMDKVHLVAQISR